MLLVLGVFGGRWAARTLTERLPGPEQRSGQIRLFILLIFLAIPVAGGLSSMAEGAEWAIPLSWVGLVSLAVSSWWLAGAFVLQLSKWSGRVIAALRPPVDTARREFLWKAGSAVAVGAPAILLGPGIRNALNGPRVVRIELPIPNLPPQFDGYTIAQISDVHIGGGPSLHHAFAEDLTARVSELGADMIAMTGDLIDGSVRQLRQQMEPFKELRAPDGVMYVTGNHEYYSGAQQWIDHMAKLGWEPLLNAHKDLVRGNEHLVIGGVPDLHSDRHGHAAPDYAKAFAGAPQGARRVLLAHQPVQLYDAADQRIDAMLAGHTHGGQFFPWNFAIHAAQPFVKGLYQHAGTQLYVNPGTAYWGPPVRLGPIPEITHVVLRRAV